MSTREYDASKDFAEFDRQETAAVNAAMKVPHSYVAAAVPHIAWRNRMIGADRHGHVMRELYRRHRDDELCDEGMDAYERFADVTLTTDEIEVSR